jgi:Rps23 Pro-64 3,4-dihydroxylase Tpa1-like proline 4-hydroxylase
MSKYWKPIIKNKNKIFPYLIIDNWYSKKEETAVWKELEFYLSIEKDNLQRAENTVVATKDGKPLGRSYRIYPNQIYNTSNRFQHSNILRFMYKQRTKEFHDLIIKAIPMGRNFPETNQDSTIISYYEEGDSYKAHTDSLLFTCLIWFHKKPKRYKGGDFYFSDNKELVENKHNRLVIFPSYYFHSVKELKFNNKKPKLGDGRFTITHFYYTIPL